MIRKLFLTLFLFVVTSVPVYASTYPDYKGYVNDYANIYSSQFKTDLEANLANYEKTTGNEIAVATIQSLENEDIEGYAVKLFEKWKIGKKGQDNGLLLLIAPTERELRFEVGYGLEPYITDGRAGEIIRNYITPEFKQGNYEAGTLAGIAEVERILTAKEIAPTQAPEPQLSNKQFGNIITFLFIAIFFIGPYIASFLGRSKQVWPGGALGGVLGGIVGLIAKSLVLGLIGFLFLGFFGLILDLILSRTYEDRKKRGLPTDWFRSGGGFFGGGGFGGGGGGFGGFGGGSSGGGGASGRW